MSETDWTEFADSIASPTIRRAPTSGLTTPAGGESFAYFWHSTSAGISGAHGLYLNSLNFAPMAKGGVISGAMCRYPSAEATGFAPMLVIGAQGDSIDDSAYILGLQDSNPIRIALRKGVISEGLPDGDASDPATAPNILRRSVESVDVGEWVHLQLEFVANAGGDTILRVYRNDLTTNSVTAPVWEAVEGMEDFTDDAVGVITGSVPHESGYVGFAFYAEDASLRAGVDHIQIDRQL